MEHERKKAVIKKRKKNVTALLLLFVAYLIVFIPGCEEFSQTKSPEIKDTNLVASWSQAQQIIQDGLVDADPEQNGYSGMD